MMTGNGLPHPPIESDSSRANSTLGPPSQKLWARRLVRLRNTAGLGHCSHTETLRL